MSDIRGREHIDDMRRRLYERGTDANAADRHTLTDEKVDVSRSWTTPTIKKAPTEDIRKSLSADVSIVTPETPPLEIVKEKHARGYRRFILLGSILIFALVAGLSSLYLYFGGNQISSDNIAIVVNAPRLVGGGEVLPLEIAVTNQNSVPIESATLILKYPPGTRSTDESGRTLFEERISINDIASGEVRVVPARVVVFGEENDDKEIVATVEYRVGGSNGMFYKDADPFQFRISSSPLVLSVESIEKVAAGQLVTVKLTARSNASTMLKDVLVSAEFPNGFSFEQSTPEPVFSQNVWRIDELKPEETTTITIQGIVRGLTEETFRINFNAGPADPNNQFMVGSILADTRADFTIERPFIDVNIKIANDIDRSVVLPQDSRPGVDVQITNTLDETVYDMVVEVVPGGNILNEDSIQGGNGFYDSNSGTVRWEVSNNESFAQVAPGASRTLSFQLIPGPARSTASFDIVVNVYARRVAEQSAQEQLIGSVRAEAKYASKVNIGRQISHVSGPVPPVAGQETVYEVTLVVDAGLNDVTGVSANTALPIYANWKSVESGDGTLTYNTVSKQLQWNIGDIGANRRAEHTFQVSIIPSTSQINQAPPLVSAIQMRANDRFTSTLLQADAPPVTTELSTEAGYKRDNGIVEAN